MYTAINAIKELDSTVTAMQANTGGVSGTGTENYLTKWQDEHTVTNSQIIDNGNSIGIGTTPTNAKVSIHSEDRPQGLQVSNISSGASASFPFYPVSPYNQLSIPTTYGIRSSATTAENPLNIANSSFASSGQINVGGLFLSQSNVNTNPDATSMGLFSHGYGGDQNYGIYAAAQGNINPNPSFNYGIYATADLNGISSAPGSVSYAGYFNGDVAVNGSLTSPSDEMLKENIQDINGASEVLKQLRPRTFQFKTQDFPSMNLPAGVRYGLIAQEVETVLPELIGMSVNPSPTDSAGNPAGTSVSYKSANYEAFIPILIKGFQEQLSANDSLKEQMATLQQQINAMQECINNLPQGMGCSNARTDNSGNSTTEPETQRIALENTLPAILYQNEPNPFGSSTLIRYYVSESTKEAMLLFHDEFGREIGRENIQQKGYGKAEINSQKLSVGIYTYSLIIDGKVADTKKMVKQ
jgi:hypothetical protein